MASCCASSWMPARAGGVEKARPARTTDRDRRTVAAAAERQGRQRPVEAGFHPFSTWYTAPASSGLRSTLAPASIPETKRNRCNPGRSPGSSQGRSAMYADLDLAGCPSLTTANAAGSHRDRACCTVRTVPHSIYLCYISVEIRRINGYSWKSIGIYTDSHQGSRWNHGLSDLAHLQQVGISG
jgi:hypothetical protein